MVSEGTSMFRPSEQFRKATLSLKHSLPKICQKLSWGEERGKPILTPYCFIAISKNHDQFSFEEKFKIVIAKQLLNPILLQTPDEAMWPVMVSDSMYVT